MNIITSLSPIAGPLFENSAGFASPSQESTPLLRVENGMIQRGITSTTSNFPVRENLDAEIHVLTPVKTPLRNMLPRVVGAGTASQYRIQTSFGTSLGTQTTTTGTTNSANKLTVANTNGFFAGETILYASTTHTITAIDSATVLSVAASPGILSNSQTNGQTVVKNSNFFPEAGTAQRMFYAEAGAPVEATTVYSNGSAAYKLIGTMGSVTGFAAAAGDSFMNQYNAEKKATIMRALLMEEYAFLHGNTSSTAAPWGDGTNNLAFQGLIPFIQGNAPAAQVQTSVGTLTVDHLQSQLTRIFYQGGTELFIMLNGTQAQKLGDLATTSGNYRLIITQNEASIGAKVAYLVHAVSGESVPIYVNPFMPQGWIVFGAMKNDQLQPTCDVSALPQVINGGLSGTESAPYSGWYAQDIAPTTTATDVFYFKVSSYEVPRWKNARVFGLSTGVTN